MKHHIVTLTDEQRNWLTSLTRTGKHAAQAITRARILLQADTKGLNQQDSVIAQNLGVQTHTVERIRKKFCQQGLETTIERKVRKDKGIPVKIDGRVEAQIIQIACSATPNDEPSWTLAMIAGELVKLELVERIARESVRRTLKKMNFVRI